MAAFEFKVLTITYNVSFANVRAHAASPLRVVSLEQICSNKLDLFTTSRIKFCPNIGIKEGGFSYEKVSFLPILDTKKGRRSYNNILLKTMPYSGITFLAIDLYFRYVFL